MGLTKLILSLVFYACFFGSMYGCVHGAVTSSSQDINTGFALLGLSVIAAYFLGKVNG